MTTRTDDTDTGLAAFECERRRLFGIAYRMLGSVRDAEDVLQEAYVRWHGVDHAAVENPAAYLTRVVTRLCIDALQAANERRIDYMGPWLPEPLIEDAAHPSAPDPESLQELADDLSTGFLLILERLNPVERAVFLLHEAFGMRYREIAPVVGKSVPNCRQIGHRARERLGDAGRARPADPAEHDRLLNRFLAATREGDVDALLETLADDVTAYGDGGGKTAAARRPVRGSANVARYVVGLASKLDDAGARVRLAAVNGRTGILTYLEDRLYAVSSLETANGRVRRIFTVVNPDKLPTPAGRADASAP
ncbi:MAG: RNA polymerase sigma-70 factor [Gemmatimonadota bacterium]